LMPFWRGERTPRTHEMGEKVGALCREVAVGSGDPTLLDWLRAECKLDPAAAESLRDYLAKQIRVAGAIPDDRTVADRDLPRPGRRGRPRGAHTVRR